MSALRERASMLPVFIAALASLGGSFEKYVSTEEKKTHSKPRSVFSRPMDTSEYAQAHGTLYRLKPKTSKRARKQATQCM